MLVVKNKMELSDTEILATALEEPLFFYHSWLRKDLGIINIAHDILTTHANSGENSNYLETNIYKEVNTLLGPDSDGHSWIHEIIDELSDMVTEIYNIDNYYCCYNEGDWGLFNHNAMEP